ncbi:PAS domain-containing protein [Methylobacterium tarhaniae]|nr:PAS domain-containing protein [Methylobacterium tarhaniae]
MTHDETYIHEIEADSLTAQSDLRLFKTAMDGIGEAVIITSRQLSRPGPVIEYVNPAFCRMTGYSAQEAVGKTPRMLQGPLTDRAVMDRLRSALETREAFQGTAINYRKDGTPYLLHWHITPMRNQAGELTHWIALQREIKPDAAADAPFEEGARRVRQITDQAAARLSGMVRPTDTAGRGRDRCTTETRDLQMHVRDTLAAIRSIARRTAETYETAEDYVMHLDGRINTISRVKSAAVQPGGYGLELGWLITQELLAFDTPSENRVTTKGPKIYLRPRMAEIIGLGIHELATNALKFGALSEAGGSVTVRWRVESRGTMPRATVTWVETGTSDLAGPPTRRGFGMKYLEHIMPRDLDATATLQFSLRGMMYKLKFPLPDAVTASD